MSRGQPLPYGFALAFGRLSRSRRKQCPRSAALKERARFRLAGKLGKVDKQMPNAKGRVRFRRELTPLLLLVASALGSAGACGGKVDSDVMGGDGDPWHSTGGSGSWATSKSSGHTSSYTTSTYPSATTYLARPIDTDYETFPVGTTYSASTARTKASTWSGAGGTYSSSRRSSGSGGATAYSSSYARGGSSASSRPASTTWSETGTPPYSSAPDPCVLGETDLIPLLDVNPYHNWVSVPAPCSIEGAFYAFSDSGADETLGTEDDSLAWPKWSGSSFTNPYNQGRVCFSGETQLWPKATSLGTVRYDLNWGAGIRFSLSQDRESRSESRYSGAIKGFRMKLEGKLEGGQTMRVGYTQGPNGSYLDSPFTPFTSLGEMDMLFEDAACPSWLTDCTDTGYAGPNPFELFIMVAGGDDAGPFDVCLTELIVIE